MDTPRYHCVSLRSSFLLWIAVFGVYAVVGLPQEKCRGQCTGTSCGPCEETNSDHSEQPNLLPTGITPAAAVPGLSVLRQPEITTLQTFLHVTEPSMPASNPAPSPVTDVSSFGELFPGTDTGQPFSGATARFDYSPPVSDPGVYAVVTTTSPRGIIPNLFKPASSIVDDASKDIVPNLFQPASSLMNDASTMRTYAIQNSDMPSTNLDSKAPVISAVNGMTLPTAFKQKRMVTPVTSSTDQAIPVTSTEDKQSSSKQPTGLGLSDFGAGQVDWLNFFDVSKDSGNAATATVDDSTSGMFSIYNAIPSHNHTHNSSDLATDIVTNVTAIPSSRINVTDSLVLPDESKRRGVGPLLVGPVPTTPVSDVSFDDVDVRHNQSTEGLELTTEPSVQPTTHARAVTNRPTSATKIPSWPGTDGTDDGHQHEDREQDGAQFDALQIACFAAPGVGALLAVIGAICVIRYATANRRLRKKLLNSVPKDQQEGQGQQQQQQQHRQQQQQRQYQQQQQQQQRDSFRNQIRYEQETNGYNQQPFPKYKLNKKLSQTSRNGRRPTA